MEKTATISPCGEYRYLLGRRWSDAAPPLVVGMLNPSKADAEVNDPTVTRLIQRATDLGCGGLVVWNLFAFRATAPADMRAAADPIGDLNDLYIVDALHTAKRERSICMVGWGTHGDFLNRHLAAKQFGEEAGVVFNCLGTTFAGQPVHPLYQPYHAALRRWS
jgi:hypothetical protein